MSSLLYVSFAVLGAMVRADLPVHCVRHQVVGDWEFTLAPPSPKRTSCGHQKPDNQDQQPPLEFVTAGGGNTKQVTLSDPNIANGDGITGTWTMIYDEGFEVVLGDQVFFAFSKFDWIQGDSGKTNISHCDATEVGWYHDKARTQFGCYVAKKVGSSGSAAEVASAPQATPKRTKPSLNLNMDSWTSDQQMLSPEVDDSDQQEPAAPAQEAAPVASELQQSVPTLQQASPLASEPAYADFLREEQPAQQESVPPQESVPDAPAQDPTQGAQEIRISGVSDASLAALHKWMSTTSVLDGPQGDEDAYKPPKPQANNFDQPLSQEWHENVVDGLNLLQMGWHAEAYSRYIGMTGKQMLRAAGLRRKIPKVSRASVAPAFLGLSSSHKTKSAARVHVAEPDTLDWRNKDGQNFLDRVITQGDCGSCYGISTVRMFSARNRVRSGNPTEPPFSINFPLYCSEYNQGCDGGYGFLQMKWSEDVGLVPETCAPYTQSGTCSMQGCNLGAKRYRGTNHHYVGGFYGGGDHTVIKQELVAGGPMVMSFEPKEDFMYYKGGVYKSGPNQIHQEWEQVDHALLLMGYGEDNGNRYWHLQNSWGNDWGEDGYFRMARGIDESGCESIAVAADVVEEDSNPTLDDFIGTMSS
jgi:cathepsin C